MSNKPEPKSLSQNKMTEDDYAVNGVSINTKEAEKFHKRLERRRKQMTDKTKEKKVKEILRRLTYRGYGESISVNDALSQLNAFYKPKIDERKLAKSINYWNTSENKNCNDCGFCKIGIKDLAHEITQKQEEIME